MKKVNNNKVTVTMNEGQTKKNAYLPPMLEVFEYEVERGFALSKIQGTTEFETFTELTDREGENVYGGEWF